MQALVCWFVFICMSLAFSEHVLDPGVSALPWNSFSFAVRHQHLNGFPFKTKPQGSLSFSTKLGDRALLLHNYPAGSNSRRLSCMYYKGCKSKNFTIWTWKEF